MKTLIAALIIFFVSIEALAIKVTVVKNGKALLDLEGQSVKEGDQFLAINEQGKKKALLTIRQVKNNKALATIDKGQAKEGFTLEPYEKKQSTARSSKEQKAWGLMAGYKMNKMSAKPPGGSVDMSGTSFDFLGFYQMQLDRNISVKLAGGYQTLVASGSASSNICGGNTTANCSVNISYLGFDALIRYSFVKTNSLEFWGGAGLGFLFAISKSSNVLDTGKITTNQTINLALGSDFYISKKNFIPLQFEYSMFPNNSSSSASQMTIYAGYGWDF
ncbi:MAG TPA: hypothetical protein VN132_13755 [Bdellovibrio sp.]|nr:hypothetical protein [Bdellovibrio sp.]